MYLKPTRHYQNTAGDQSPYIADVVGQRVTLDRSFNAGLRKGTWRGTPFQEIKDVPPQRSMPAGLREMKAAGGPLSVREALPLLFDEVTGVVERAWKGDKMHVVFHSSGYDSRIISACVKRLVEKHGPDWLGPGLLFLGNRWEADGARAILEAEGWADDQVAMYEDGTEEDHFGPWLDFDTFWHTANAPLPIAGNLWWYLPDWAQKQGLLPDDNQCQAFAGFFANETWRCWNQDGARVWHDDLNRWYYYTVLCVYRQKLPTEYPLTDLGLLKLVSRVQRTSGDELRKALAEYACPEANHVPKLTLDDRGHTISSALRRRCEAQYASSWYANHVHDRWRAPDTSEYDLGWTRWGLASLCEELTRRGVEIK